MKYTSELAVDQVYTAVDGLCQQQVWMIDSINSTGSTNGITPMNTIEENS